jgi:hypothetical protein
MVPLSVLLVVLRMYALLQRPFQKFCGLYLLATRTRATDESLSVGKTPIEEDRKCSPEALAKDFCKDRTRSA